MVIGQFVNDPFDVTINHRHTARGSGYVDVVGGGDDGITVCKVRREFHVSEFSDYCDGPFRLKKFRKVCNE